jgi:hypothetical protein
MFYVLLILDYYLLLKLKKYLQINLNLVKD